MTYNITEAVDLLSRTPAVLRSQLNALPARLLYNNEGADTWTPLEVVGHLIINEETNFLARIRLIMSGPAGATLTPIDMNAHRHRFSGSTMTEILSEFTDLRMQNVGELQAMRLSEPDLEKQAAHPVLGPVSIGQILATWVAHDLSHIGQIVRVIAKQYKEDLGPFIKYLTRLN